jgi:hypothetical protein
MYPQAWSDGSQFQVQNDARSNTVFRLCWHLRLPGSIRLNCHLFI